MANSKKQGSNRISVISVMLVSICTLASRILGLVRELLFVRSLGARAMSDAFLTALRIPNTFYEIFAGGACSPAVLPVLTKTRREQGEYAANQLITTVLGILCSSMVLLCYIISCFPQYALALLVPGFTAEQVYITIALLRIFLIFMWVNTGTAILAEALRSKKYFFIPSMGQVIVNTSFIAGLFAYIWLNLAITSLAYFVVTGGIAQFLMHLIASCYIGYRPAFPSRTTWQQTAIIIKKFFPCVITSGINEIALFIELQFASYLPVGSISLMTYASSIMRLPFGVLVHPLATVALPELTRVQSYAPRRLAFLMFEMLKVIIWALGPLIILMTWFSHDIFLALYGTSQLSARAIITLQHLLLIKLCGLLFLSINHVCLQIFYVRHETEVPTMVSLATAAWSIVATYMLYPKYGMYGIAISGVATMVVRTLIFLHLLNFRINIARYSKRFLIFLKNTCLQWLLCIVPWLGIVSYIRFILSISSAPAVLWYTKSLGLLIWVAPCCLVLACLLWFSRQEFLLKFYFLN